jgi:hypothetical protein
MPRGLWWENQKRPLENLDVGGRIMLNWILGKDDGVVWRGFIWLRILTRVGFL